MPNNQIDMLNTIKDLQERLTQTQLQYWKEYSSFNSWQFWVLLALFLLPLVILFFSIDRRKIFLLGFYGLNIHVWFTYVDQLAVRRGYWIYPYRLIPYLPYSWVLDVAIIPAVYMLIYQWTMNHNKNFYIYSTAASLVFAFVFKPLLRAFDLFSLDKGMNYFYLFIINTLVFLFSKFITNIFLSMRKRA